MHTCHRKWRKEPPTGQMETISPVTLPASAAHRHCPHLEHQPLCQPAGGDGGVEENLPEGRETWVRTCCPTLPGATPKGRFTPEPVTQPTKCSRKCPNLTGSFRGVSVIKRRPVHGAALLAASPRWSVGMSEPCLPRRAVPRAGHRFHSALPPTRAQVLSICSRNVEANGWTASARMGHRQSPALPLLPCEGAFAFLAKLSVSGPPPPCPVVSLVSAKDRKPWTTMHAHCLVRATGRTCLGTDVRAWPSASTEKHSCRLKPQALEPGRPGLEPQ